MNRNQHAGEVTLVDLDGAGIVRLPTLQCVHCQAHWVPRKGSGKVRGFCSRCMGPVCGPACAECVPAQQQLENLEHGRPAHFRPVLVRGS